MTLADKWKLNDYIPKSREQLIKAALNVWTELAKQVPGVDVALAGYKHVSPMVEMSGKDAEKAGGVMLSQLMNDWEKNKIPAWAVIPLSLIITAMGAGEFVKTTAAVNVEKNVLQPLRKNLAPTLLDPRSAIDAERRGIMKKEDVEDQLGRQGLSPALIAAMRQLADYVPNANDIVQFAVREVYNSSIVSQFQQDANLSEVLEATKEDRKKAGLDDKSFSKYWLAHWDLPGIHEAFSMLHRGLISRDQLDMLLQAKDVMPFWRDKLLGISYDVITRVDVRRLHKMKLISDQELAGYYRKMGYDATDAEKLAKFTIEYNKSPEKAEQTDADEAKAKERDLTKSEIVDLYSEQFIGGDKAKELLGTLGYSTDEITMLLARQDNKLIKDYTLKYIDLLHDLYVKGVEDRSSVEKKMQEIPLESDHITRLFTLWELERLKAVDYPTKADVLRWLKKKYIDEEYATELLINIGVHPGFVSLYIKENT